MSSNTPGGPSRRERMRAETIAEIKASARSQLLEHGAGGISLRAIAREVGVSPAALYRYFDSLDSLLIELCCDFYDELIAVTREAMDAHPAECHLERMKTWIWSFRTWAVSHRSEFELMINSPDGWNVLSILPEDAEQPLEGFTPVGERSLRHARMCGRELAAYYRQTEGEGFDFSLVQTPELSEGLQREIREHCAALVIGEDLPVSWIFSFMSGWVRVFGLVTMETFGSLPIRENVDEFYKTQILAMMKDFGIEP